MGRSAGGGQVGKGDKIIKTRTGAECIELKRGSSMTGTSSVRREDGIVCLAVPFFLAICGRL